MISSIHSFIVTPEEGKVYKNSTVIDGKDFILNTHLNGDDKDLLQHIGDVLHSPLNNYTSCKEGDRVFVQHNTFRVWSDQEGNLQHGKILSEGEYFVRPDHVFAFHNGKEWISTNNWIFLHAEPFKHDDVLESRETFRPDRGVIAFEQDPEGNDTTLNVGDNVIFKTGNRVTCTIDGKTYLRVRNKDILLNRGKW